MSHTPQEEPFSQTNLNSPEYRERLMRKLNCLIAVLEVATAKVRKSLASPVADQEKLIRIRANLQSTLEVCLRARAALERREALPRELPENLNQMIMETSKPKALEAPAASKQMLERRSDLRSKAEQLKFERMGPLDRREIAHCDLEALTRQLQG